MDSLTQRTNLARTDIQGKRILFRAVAYALEQPAAVDVNEIIIRPIASAA